MSVSYNKLALAVLAAGLVDTPQHLRKAKMQQFDPLFNPRMPQVIPAQAPPPDPPPNEAQLSAMAKRARKNAKRAKQC